MGGVERSLSSPSESTMQEIIKGDKKKGGDRALGS